MARASAASVEVAESLDDAENTKKVIQYEPKGMSDFSIKVAGGWTLKVHRTTIAGASRFFHRWFLDDTVTVMMDITQGGTQINALPQTYAFYKCFFDYLYKPTVQIALEDLGKVLDAANYFDVPTLIERCKMAFLCLPEGSRIYGFDASGHNQRSFLAEPIGWQSVSNSTRVAWTAKVLVPLLPLLEKTHTLESWVFEHEAFRTALAWALTWWLSPNNNFSSANKRSCSSVSSSNAATSAEETEKAKPLDDESENLDQAVPSTVAAVSPSTNKTIAAETGDGTDDDEPVVEEPESSRVFRALNVALCQAWSQLSASTTIRLARLSSDLAVRMSHRTCAGEGLHIADLQHALSEQKQRKKKTKKKARGSTTSKNKKQKTAAGTVSMLPDSTDDDDDEEEKKLPSELLPVGALVLARYRDKWHANLVLRLPSTSSSSSSSSAAAAPSVSSDDDDNDEDAVVPSATGLAETSHGKKKTTVKKERKRKTPAPPMLYELASDSIWLAGHGGMGISLTGRPLEPSHTSKKVYQLIDTYDPVLLARPETMKVHPQLATVMAQSTWGWFPAVLLAHNARTKTMTLRYLQGAVSVGVPAFCVHPLSSEWFSYIRTRP